MLVVLHIEGHGHLYGVNPCPPAVEALVLGVRGLHLVVQVGFDAVGLRGVQLHVGLAAALVIGVTGAGAVAWCPLVEISPPPGIVYVAFLRVNALQGHQPLVVDGTCPQRAGAYLLPVGGHGGVFIFVHEVVVGKAGQRQHFISRRLCTHGECNEGEE